MKVVDDIEKFVAGFGNGIRFAKSKWFEDGSMRVYMRFEPMRHFRSKSGDAVYKRILTVSNVSVNEELRGKGIYSQFLAEIESVATKNNIDGIMIENVLDPNQTKIYTDRGYVKLNNGEPSPWFLKQL